MRIMINVILVLFSFLITTNGNPVYALKDLTKTNKGFVGKLLLVSGHSRYPDDIRELLLEVFFEKKQRIHVKITDYNKERYEVYPWIIKEKTPKKGAVGVNYDISFVENPFGFVIRRLNDGEVVFNCSNLVYSDQYISFVNNFVVSDPNLFGFGEKVGDFKLHTDNHYYTLWNRGIYKSDANVYTSHPFCMELRNGKANGMFLFNSNAMDIVINHKTMEFRTIGGVIDLYIFTDNTPQSVVQNYHKLIGTPYFQNRWSLGYHHCRYGFKNVSQVFDVAKKYIEYDIPLDSMWIDIDHMQDYKDFTFDSVNFPIEEMKNLVDYLHKNDKHLVLIVDPGIKVEKGYFAYDIGMEKDIFIKRKGGKVPIFNKVWPGYTVFPDWSNPDTKDYWKQMIYKIYDDIKVSGIWIDMNEIEGFCDGECYPKSEFRFDPVHPPYKPGFEDLKTGTISMDAVHYDGNIEYNVHSLFALMEANITSQILEEIRGKRSFVLSRSGWASLGTIASHWTGDNKSSYEDLRMSISMILQSNLAGVTSVGADVCYFQICGFDNDTSKELCKKWLQIAAFYPFARNHNNKHSKPQNPWSLGIVKSARYSLNLRYSLIPFFYSCMFLINANGGVFWSALWFEFPEDKNTVFVDTQFFVCKGILVSPYLLIDEKSEYYQIYVPKGNWYDYYTHKKYSYKEGRYVNVTMSSDKTSILYRGGFIIPSQIPSLSTKQQEFNDIILTVCLSLTNKAEGNLYLDDGESLGTIKNKKYSLIHYYIDDDKGSLVSKIVLDNYSGISKTKYGKILILGSMKHKVTVVTVNGKITPFVFKNSNIIIDKLNIWLNNTLTVRYS